jgi:hypothetical protein
LASAIASPIDREWFSCNCEIARARCGASECCDMGLPARCGIRNGDGGRGRGSCADMVRHGVTPARGPNAEWAALGSCRPSAEKTYGLQTTTMQTPHVPKIAASRPVAQTCCSCTAQPGGAITKACETCRDRGAPGVLGR